jgi:hypothetical protein
MLSVKVLKKAPVYLKLSVKVDWQGGWQPDFGIELACMEKQAY